MGDITVTGARTGPGFYQLPVVRIAAQYCICLLYGCLEKDDSSVGQVLILSLNNL